jgi:hypothetical protein
MPFWNPFNPPRNRNGTTRWPWESEEIAGSPSKAPGPFTQFQANRGMESILDALNDKADPYGGGIISRGGSDVVAQYGDAVRRLLKKALNSGGPAGTGLASTFGPPSIQDIIGRLEALQDPSRFMMSDQDLSQQAMAAASAQYDPIIAALRGQMSSAESRANRNKGILGQMFSSLSGSLEGDIPEIQQQFAQDKQSSAAQYKDLESDIKQQYATSQAEQEAMMRRLGIEAAASEVLPQQMRDRDYFTNLATTEGQTQQSALTQEENSAVNYTREGAQIAQSEGANRQADLMAQLQDLLAEYEGQIGANESAKQAAYTSGLGQLRNQMLQDAYSRSDREAANYLEMINLGRMLRKDEFELGPAGQAVTSAKSPADIASRALSLGIDDNGAQDIQDIFMSTIGTDPTILSGREAMFGQTVPKEALAQRIVEAGRNAGLSEAELNALMTIALEYFGRR